jgi:serine protease
MKRLSKAIIATLALSTCTAAIAEEFEFVVKQKQSAMQFAKSADNIQKVKGKRSVVIDGFKISNVSIDANTMKEALEKIKSSGEFEYVEPVVLMQTPKPAKASSYERGNSVSSTSTSGEPNDTHFGEQREYLRAFTSGNNGWVDFKTGHDFVSSWANMSDGSALSRVGVADSGFAPHPDIRFATESSDFIDMDNDATNETWMRDNPGCTAHGNGVSSAVSATTNNAMGIAGAGKNVEVVASRVLNCGFGGTQFADAVYWFSGFSYSEQGVADISKPVDVINISLGGYVTGGCLTHVQEAIDYAVERGIPVVVAAGNTTINVENFLPAGCDNVIVVGATDWMNERTGFSNYGDRVDISAQGVDILGAGLLDESNENYVLWWEGTSNAAPLVTAAIANVKSEVDGLSVDEITYLLTSTSRSYDEGTTCTDSDRSCGAGSLDANAFLEAAKLYSTGDLSYIRHALADNTTCDNSIFIDSLSSEIAICELYEVTLNALADNKAGVTYNVYRVAKGGTLTVGGADVETIISDESSPNQYLPLTVEELTNFDYGFTTCDNGVCSSEIIELSVDAEKVAECP